MLNLEVFAEKGAIAWKDLELFQFADTPQQAFEILKAGLTVDLEHEAAFEREHALPGVGVPETPAPPRRNCWGQT